MLNAVFSPIGFQGMASASAPNARRHQLKMKGLADDPWALSSVCNRSATLPVLCRIKRRTTSPYTSGSDTKDFNDNAAGS